MTTTKELIIQLKEARKQKGLSFDKILDLMKQNGDYLSKSTLSRVFAKGSEDKSFRYEETLRPIAKVLLDETISISAPIESEMDNIAFLNHQVEVKDRRIDLLLSANVKLLDQLLYLCKR